MSDIHPSTVTPNADTAGGQKASGSRPATAGLRPHAFDPIMQPELFTGILTKRAIAFMIDLIVITLPILGISLLIGIFGLITFGFGWLLFGVLTPAIMVWAILYYAMTFGGPHSATVGMRVMDIEMRTWYGDRAYGVLGAAHGASFWILISLLTPLLLVVGFFNSRRRQLHDILLGTVIINKVPGAAVVVPPR